MPTKEIPTLDELIKLLNYSNLTAAGYTVTRYGYRQQRVVGADVTDGPFDYKRGDQFYRLRNRLADAAGNRVDNHETYVVETPEGQSLCLWFHDWRLAVGTAIQPY